jgi:SulP family sulfate permease
VPSPFAQIKSNWKSGVTVSLVSLPLAISLGVAAGATPLMGVITAVWAGLVAALLGGSHYNVIGPTGALSGILATYAIIHGAEALPLLAIFSGVVTLGIFALRWEKYFILIPASVIHGFTLGVAFIIALNQLNFALGLSGLRIHEDFFDNVVESLLHLSRTHVPTLILFALGFIFLKTASKFIPQIPVAALLAPIGILLGYFGEKHMLPFAFETLGSRFDDIAGHPWAPISFSFSLINKSALIAGLTVSVVAILETLISAKIADGMTNTRSDQRKEVLGLGVANIASGFMGGIPATAALARTALNVRSGATHRTSAGINAVVIAVIALVFLPFFKYLPLALVASMLVLVAVQMVEHEHFRHLYRHDKTAFALSLVVALITVIEDPIVGIMVGAVVSLLLFVNTISKAQGEITLKKNKQVLGRFQPHELKDLEDHGDMLVYRFAGQLTYISAQAHIQTISEITSSPRVVILSLRNLFYLDVDGLDAIAEIIEMLESKGKKVGLSGINPLIAPLIENADWYPRLLDAKRVFPTTSQALEVNWE